MNYQLFNREYFSGYLTGLFEAVGTIKIPKNKPTSTHTDRGSERGSRYPKIILSFHKNNKILAEVIKDIIGHGSIYNKRKNITYEINNKEGIIKFIELTNNNYRTPKIQEFNNMVKYMNVNLHSNLPLSTIDSSSFDNNAWIVGFLGFIFKL